MAYFSYFPFITYRFGDQRVTTTFQDISAYVDVIDSIKDNVSFYTTQSILDNERPDNLSTRLYGNAGLYWTFYYMNDHIRERGWPLNVQQLQQYAERLYPYTTLVTRSSLTGVMLPGQTITGLTSGAVATVVSRRLDFGQINVDVTSGRFLPNELISSDVGGTVQTLQIVSVIEQKNAIQEWRDSDGRPVDIDPAVGTSGFDTPITFYERLVEQNDALRTIRVIKPESITAVQSAFRDALSK